MAGNIARMLRITFAGIIIQSKTNGTASGLPSFERSRHCSLHDALFSTMNRRKSYRSNVCLFALALILSNSGHLLTGRYSWYLSSLACLSLGLELGRDCWPVESWKSDRASASCPVFWVCYSATHSYLLIICFCQPWPPS